MRKRSPPKRRDDLLGRYGPDKTEPIYLRYQVTVEFALNCRLYSIPWPVMMAGWCSSIFPSNRIL